MATPRLGLVVEDKPTELSCLYIPLTITHRALDVNMVNGSCLSVILPNLSG